jgi:NADPH-dependent 2,4-dienoyl-CoA reductase/sulfur reductase-like enzyme
MVRNKRILIIGGVAAGTSAASKARRIDPDARIKIIHNKVYTEALDSNRLILDYDSLVIATGARSAVPKIKGIFFNDDINIRVNKSSTIVKGLLLLRNYGDGIHIQDSIRNSKSCVTVGAGLIGVEMAEAFRRRGIDVTIVEMADHVLPSLLDEAMADIVKKELEDNGVKVILGEALEEVVTSLSPSSSSNVRYIEGVRTTKNKEIPADLVLLGTGVRPNSQIAKEAGIELGVYDAIKVDEHMRTNIPDIFAAGDCATARNYITNKYIYLPLGTTANKQGRVAGENAAGGNAEFKGVAGSVITKTFDLYVGKTGLDKKEALENGFDPVEKEIKSVTRAGYYPDKKSIIIKLVADKKNRRILGAQIIGGEAVKGRIDLIAFALLTKATVDDLANYDACYVPPVSPVWEPINIAASQTAKMFA